MVFDLSYAIKLLNHGLFFPKEAWHFMQVAVSGNVISLPRSGFVWHSVHSQAQRQVRLVAVRKRLLGRGKRHGSVMHILADGLRRQTALVRGGQVARASEKEHRQRADKHDWQSRNSGGSVHDSLSV